MSFKRKGKEKRMKVKIFVGNDIKRMEDEVNEFIKDKSVIDIKYQSMGLTTKYNGNGIPINVVVYDRVLVMYADEE